MLKNHSFISTQKKQRVAKHPNLTVTDYWSLAATLILALLISACGNNQEITHDMTLHETELGYYPMSVGNRWVYRNPDGSEWAREVTETDIIASRQYYIFSNSRPIGDYQWEYLKKPAYEITHSHLLLLTGHEVRDMMEDVIYGTDVVPFLTSYKTTVDMGSTFVLLRFPVDPGKTWETLNIKLTGGSSYGHQPPWPKHQRQDLSFEADWVISASAGQLESVKTPAGTFENCVKVVYKPKQHSVEVKADGKANPDFREALLRTREKLIRDNLTTLFTSVMPKLGLETVWLAPGVGLVKIESAEGTAVLIDYEVK